MGVYFHSSAISGSRREVSPLLTTEERNQPTGSPHNSLHLSPQFQFISETDKSLILVEFILQSWLFSSAQDSEHFSPFAV